MASVSNSFSLGGDMPVSRLGFGAMRLTGRGVLGEPPDREAAKAVLRRAVELGVNLLDTADSYGPEVSERLIGETLFPYPEGLVIATKGGLLRRGGGWSPDGRPLHLRNALDGSLRRLRLERIDLYQLHAVDPRVPIEDSVGALAEMQRQGKIRHLGLSNVDADELARAQRVTRIVSVQNLYHVQDRGSDDVLGVCEREGLGFLPWYPLATGSLARGGGRLGEVARRRGATPAQVALAWLLRRSPVMLPIPGTSSLAHLEENAAAVDITLSDEEFHELSAMTADKPRRR